MEKNLCMEIDNKRTFIIAEALMDLFIILNWTSFQI